LAANASPSSANATVPAPAISSASAATVKNAGHASYVFSEIGPSATGEMASSSTAVQTRTPDAPTRASRSATTMIVAAPHSAISVLKAAS